MYTNEGKMGGSGVPRRRGMHRRKERKKKKKYHYRTLESRGAEASRSTKLPFMADARLGSRRTPASQESSRPFKQEVLFDTFSGCLLQCTAPVIGLALGVPLLLSCNTCNGTSTEHPPSAHLIIFYPSPPLLSPDLLSCLGSRSSSLQTSRPAVFLSLRVTRHGRICMYHLRLTTSTLKAMCTHSNGARRTSCGYRRERAWKGREGTGKGKAAPCVGKGFQEDGGDRKADRKGPKKGQKGTGKAAPWVREGETAGAPVQGTGEALEKRRAVLRAIHVGQEMEG